MKEAGFIFVYLSYENASNNYVYFDDFKVTHTKSNIVQSNEYYPFGQLAAGSWTRENAADNRYLANGGTELNRTSNLYDLEYRNYDPILGRLHQVDPMAAKYASVTPYNYSFNNAVNLTDPSGADPENQSHGMWFSGGHYTYDDIVPNKYPDVMAYSGREGVMGVAGWGGQGRSGIFAGFNSLVNSTVANNNAKEALANNIVNGIASALAGGEGTYAVNTSNGVATNLGSDLGIALLTAMEYHSLHGTTSLISNLSVVSSGVLGTGERYYNFRLRGATAGDPMSHYATALSSSGKAEYMEMYSGSIRQQTSAALSGFGPGTPEWNSANNWMNGVGFVIGGASFQLSRVLDNRLAYSGTQVWTGKVIQPQSITFRTPVGGITTSTAFAKNLSTTLKVGGVALGVVGAGMTVMEITSGQKNFIGEGGLDLAFGAIGFVPGWGWAVSGLYFGGKYLLQETGNDFWDH